MEIVVVYLYEEMWLKIIIKKSVIYLGLSVITSEVGVDVDVDTLFCQI